MQSFGDRLRALRLKKGLSQEETARRLGVSPQAVSKWETDKCSPECSLILPLARLFGVTADRLLDGGDRRAHWEEQWQEALRRGGERAALAVAEEALEELPGDRQFRYRRGCGEYILARQAGTEEEKRRRLAAAERHLASLHADEPEFASASGMLVAVLADQERREEAAALARTLEDGDRFLLRVLQGEALRTHRGRLLTKEVRQLAADLIGCGTPEAVAAAEGILRDVLGAEGLFAEMLIQVQYTLAASELAAGRPEEAMARVEAMAALTRKWAGAGGYYRSPEKAPFLAPEDPKHFEEHLWESLRSALENAPALAPLRERADFRALLAEARENRKKE